MFWTDYEQASQRLSNCTVNYDGKPFYILHVEEKSKGLVATGTFLMPKAPREYVSLSLEDKEWNNFRDLPVLGWHNAISGASSQVFPRYIKRRAINTRTHGLCANNTFCYSILRDAVERDRDLSITHCLKNAGYLETSQDPSKFPKLSSLLLSLGEGSGAAFSYRFCVYRSAEGMWWLFRNNTRIGFFAGVDSLVLFPKSGFYQEELEACPSFDIKTIKEF